MWGYFNSWLSPNGDLTGLSARAGLCKIWDGSSGHGLLHPGGRGSERRLCQSIITVGSFQLDTKSVVSANNVKVMFWNDSTSFLAHKPRRFAISRSALCDSPGWGAGLKPACWKIWKSSWLRRWRRMKRRSVSPAWLAPGGPAWAAPPWWRPFSSWLRVSELHLQGFSEKTKSCWITISKQQQKTNIPDVPVYSLQHSGTAPLVLSCRVLYQWNALRATGQVTNIWNQHLTCKITAFHSSE